MLDYFLISTARSPKHSKTEDRAEPVVAEYAARIDLARDSIQERR